MKKSYEFLKMVVITVIVGNALLWGLTRAAHTEELAYTDSGSRDPFVPLIGPDGEVKFSFDSSEMNIEGIIYDPKGESLVLINGEFYREGEAVLQSNVISIYKDRVILEQDNEKQELWIREEILNEEQKQLKTF